MDDTTHILTPDDPEAGVTRIDLQIEREKIQLERERLALERDKLAAERERWQCEANLRLADSKGIKVRLSTTFLSGICLLLLGSLLGGLWTTLQHDKTEAQRQHEAAQRRQQLAQALSGETNLTERSGALIRALGGTAGGGGILLILD